ncbi:hypothetical protein K458DRAFT_89423 [Lentithecium fluviatile CBS 122367]|uniref:Uncharacterized protein n=1 Tax=Lentithecium fluviatile CBS 122367 TaxID=1168545 RepID=A0A6G1IRP3_9PLEO|nr:hypothetical protein K458DRAFT_89423 [Lentithecium fluviatile CBS 122367]
MAIHTNEHEGNSDFKVIVTLTEPDSGSSPGDQYRHHDHAPLDLTSDGHNAGDDKDDAIKHPNITFHLPFIYPITLTPAAFDIQTASIASSLLLETLSSALLIQAFEQGLHNLSANVVAINKDSYETTQAAQMQNNRPIERIEDRSNDAHVVISKHTRALGILETLIGSTNEALMSCILEIVGDLMKTSEERHCTQLRHKHQLTESTKKV